MQSGPRFWQHCLFLAVWAVVETSAWAGEYITLAGPRTGPTSVTWTVEFVNGVPYNSLPPPLGRYAGPIAIPALQQAATNGSPAAAAWLAKLYWDGRPELPPNRVEAYRWALIARGRNYKPIAPFLAEFELFLKPEDQKEGQARARAFLANGQKPK